MTCTYEKDVLLDTAVKLKDIGNGFFKKKDYGKALEKYCKALKYIQPLMTKQQRDNFGEEDAKEWAHGGVEPKQRNDFTLEHMTIKLNIVQVHLNTKRWRDAIVLCDDVILLLR